LNKSRFTRHLEKAQRWQSHRFRHIRGKDGCGAGENTTPALPIIFSAVLTNMTILHMGFTKKHHSITLGASLKRTGYHEKNCDPATGAIQSAFLGKKEKALRKPRA